MEKYSDGNRAPVIPVRTLYSIVIKRILDVTLCSLALIVLSPLLLIIAVMELVYHGRPIIYTTRRPGKNNKVFKLYKFRSMTNEKDTEGILLPGDKRLTKFGYFIRKTSIDELPELINVIKGDMSIIGPRPLLIEYLQYYSPRHAMRHSVRPGLTCERIIDTSASTWTWSDQFENDVYYVEHISLKTDIKMLIAVIKAVHRRSEYRASDTRVPFLGSNLNETGERTEAEKAIRFDSLSR